MSQHHISNQLKRFLITGVSTTLVDLVCYSAFLYIGMGFMLAKASSFLCAVSFAYIGHRSWTFMTHGSTGRLAAFATLYVCALVFNNAVNLSMLELFGKQVQGIAIAFVIASGTTAAINFTVMRFFIFRPVQHNDTGALPVED